LASTSKMCARSPTTVDSLKACTGRTPQHCHRWH
jgi:hypothetical protein